MVDMAEYSMRVQIADITIRFKSDLESDIGNLSSFFKYHQIDSAQEADCIVKLKRQASFFLPKDVEMLWQSKRQGISEPEGRFGRRRVYVSSKFNTDGIASCYVSRKRSEYYYGLMQDKSWICCQPSEHQIKIVLRQPRSNKNKVGECEVTNPLNAMPLLIHIIATTFGRFLIHGAAVGINGMASLFLGESGSGKSTLCTDLAKQKASFMGDDIVLIYMKNGIPMVGSLLFPAKLYLDNSEEKTEVDVPEQFQTTYNLSAPLKAIYSVQQSGQPTSTVEPRPSAELLQQLMEASNGMMMQYDRQQWLNTMYDICECVPFFLFDFGNRSTLSISIFNN